MLKHRKGRRTLAGGYLAGYLHAALADAARRGVDDAVQAQLILRNGDDVHICQHILDLSTVKEACAANDAVRHTGALESVFKLVRLRVHAVEHRVVAPVLAAAVVGHYLRGDVLRLLVLIVGDVKLYLVAVVLIRPQLLALAPLIVADNGVGSIQYVAGAAVILLKADGAALLILALERENILYRRAAEFIDALVIVADDADIAEAAREQRREQVLQAVRILILVDEDVSETALPVCTRVLVLLKELNGEEYQIVKVHSPGGKHAAHVLRVYLARLAAEEIPARLGLTQILLRADLLILGAAYRAEDDLGRVGLVVKVEVLDDVLYKARAVRGVVNAEIGREAELLRVAPQYADAGGVEGAGPDVVRFGAEHIFKTGFQLARRFVGKGDGKDAPRLYRIERRNAPPLLAAVLHLFDIFLRRAGGDILAVGRTAIFQKICDAVD